MPNLLRKKDKLKLIAAKALSQLNSKKKKSLEEEETFSCSPCHSFFCLFHLQLQQQSIDLSPQETKWAHFVRQPFLSS